MEEERKVYKVLVGKPEGKRTLGRPRRRWEDGIRMDLREIDLGSVDWIRVAHDRDRWRTVVSAVMNLRVLAPRRYFLVTSIAAYSKIKNYHSIKRDVNVTEMCENY
jgi:hypothetical protein